MHLYLCAPILCPSVLSVLVLCVPELCVSVWCAYVLYAPTLVCMYICVHLNLCAAIFVYTSFVCSSNL